MQKLDLRGKQRQNGMAFALMHMPRFETQEEAVRWIMAQSHTVGEWVLDWAKRREFIIEQPGGVLHGRGMNRQGEVLPGGLLRSIGTNGRPQVFDRKMIVEILKAAGGTMSWKPFYLEMMKSGMCERTARRMASDAIDLGQIKFIDFKTFVLLDGDKQPPEASAA